MFGRYVETLSLRVNDKLYPFTQEMQTYLKQHITIGNLEGPIPDIHTPTPINGFSFSFPAWTPQLLKESGITAVSLANNHMFDKGRAGYEQTRLALDKENISYFGGYSPTEETYFETKMGTTTVIVYGITMIATGWDEAQAITVTQKIRKDHPTAHLVAFLHWGDEYVTQYIYQRAFAHTLIDNGVDVIIGSHPHVVQGVEVYNNKPIFYSLGNFIFDQYWNENTENGIMVRMTDSPKDYVYEIIPIRQTLSVPSIATSTIREQILSEVSQQSDADSKTAVLQGILKIAK